MIWSQRAKLSATQATSEENGEYSGIPDTLQPILARLLKQAIRLFRREPHASASSKDPLSFDPANRRNERFAIRSKDSVVARLDGEFLDRSEMNVDYGRAASLRLQVRLIGIDG
jgi:hypothetical protein